MMAGRDLEEFFQAAQGDQQPDDTYQKMGISQPPAPPQTRMAMQRVARKKKRHKALRRTLIIAFFVVFVAAAWFIFSRVNLSSVSTQQTQDHTNVQDYPGPGSGSVEFTVETGDSSAVIGERLTKDGIVASADIFTQAVLNANAESSLQPGIFTLKYRMSAEDVVDILTDPSNSKGLLQVTSDARVSDIVKEAAELSGTPEKDFTAIIKDHGKGILPDEANGSFEGWLEPGTYDVKSMKSARKILTKMVKDRIDKLDTLGVPTGSERERILTIASIVEGEVNKAEYYPKVTRVILNRLDKNMALGMDSVVAYGNNVAPRQLTTKMLNDTSNPYNSRIKKGLPPTPINNPSNDTIAAAMNPADGDWLYFVTVNLDTGETKFTKSVSQFEKYSKEYAEWEKNN
ncbi:MAG: endolytic transglycosylase MltG [Bifidobacteriaceae bacterium]|jgi:UPF0755 protein|nr:endolytic transglycosylase MltG [Bifidobacteriaceae bacterium]MCI1914111.1 endolytic transglycosylase MltG [Bifidobacteriaceae bacterium]